MIPIFIFRKILLALLPLVLFYFLRKIGKSKKPQNPHRSFADKSNIVEGEIIKD